MSASHWLGLLGAFAAVAAPSTVYTLNHFYVDGAATDSWFLAWTVWRNGVGLDTPASIAADRSFFGTHFSPILVIPALASHFVPIGMFAWYALFAGMVHGLVAAAVFQALHKSLGASDRRSLLVAFAAAIGYGLGGFAVAALQLPHYELLFVAFGILFLAALARDSRVAAWVWFVLTLAVREDAGLHLFCVLLAAQLLCRRHSVWPFMGAALGYAVLAFALKHALWPSEGQMTRVFTGNPPYAHLTWALLQERLSTIFLWRGYVWQTALVAILWALWARDRLIVAGIVAALPWAVLCISAASGAPGTLDQYYSFPLFLASAWPIVALRWRHGEAVTPRLRRHALAWTLAMALAASFAWRDGAFCYPCAKSLYSGLPRSMPQVDEFAGRLREGLPQLGKTRVDMAVMALWPDAGARLDWLYPDSQLLRGNDSILWFEGSLQASLAWAAALTSGLTSHYRVAGTNIVVASNRPLEQSAVFAPQLRRTNLVWDRMRPTPIARRESEGFVVPRAARPGPIAEGPHSWMLYGINSQHSLTLPEGRYEARFEARAAHIADPGAPVLRLEVGFAGGPTVAARDIRASDLPHPGGGIVAVPFEVTAAQRDLFLQLRAIHLGNADLVLRSVSLARVD
jgi:hypothetical protein